MRILEVPEAPTPIAIESVILDVTRFVNILFEEKAAARNRSK